MIYYQPKYFQPQELLPPEIYDEIKEEGLWLIDYRMLKTVDILRDFFGKPITINNWVFGGDRKYSGLRPFNTIVGAKYSQHKYGRAMDCIIMDVPAEDARHQIMLNQQHFSCITCMEKGVSWLHIDCRATNVPNIILIDP